MNKRIAKWQTDPKGWTVVYSDGSIERGNHGVRIGRGVTVRRARR